MTRRTQMQRKGSRGSKPRTNPIHMRRSNKVKNTFSFDGTFLNGILFFDSETTGTNVGSDWVDVGTDSGFGATRSFTDMVKRYREYRYTKIVVEWIPKVAPGVADGGSQIVFCYTDNPEHIAFIHTGATTDTQRRNFAIGARSNIEFNAWERVTWNVPLSHRLPWYNVNTSMVSTTNVDEIERSIQGIVLAGYLSLSAAVVLGTFRTTYHVEFRGLNTDAGAIV